MNPVELVREEGGLRKWVLVDVWENRGRHYARAAFSAFPTNELELDEPCASKEEAEQLAAALIERLRGDGWKDELSPEEQERIDNRVALQAAKEAAAQALTNARIAAFPVTDLDRKLAAAIAAPAGVTELDLRGAGDDKLSIVPPSIGALVGLRTLILDGNELTALPQEMESLANLRYLSVARNSLTEMRPFCYLKKLRILNLHNNRIENSYTGHHQKDFEVQLGGNPIEKLGFFTGIRILGIDTERLFPIGDRVERASKKLRTIHLYGRAPTQAELDEARRLFPNAEVTHVGAHSQGPRIVTVLDAELVGAEEARGVLPGVVEAVSLEKGGANAGGAKARGAKASGAKATGAKTIRKAAASDSHEGSRRGAGKAARIKAPAKKAVGKKAATRKAATKKAPTQKATGKKAASSKATRAKAARTKAARTKTASTKAASTKAKAARTKAASSKVASSKAASSKAATKKAPSTKAASTKASSTKAASTNAATKATGKKAPSKGASSKA